MKERLNKAKKLAKKLNLDALLVCDASNIRHLSTYTGTSGKLCITTGKIYFITDARYRSIAQTIERKYGIEFLEIAKKSTNWVQELCSKHRIKKLGFEDNAITYAHYLNLRKTIKKVKLRPLYGALSELRRMKSEEELRLIRKSQRINEKTLATILRTLYFGATEREVAAEIKKIGMDYGADDVSFEPIVAFGAHGATPHHQNTTRKLKKGDTILIDMGMKFHGYCSDMTRCFFTKKPTKEQERVYNLVLESQERAIKQIRTGTLCRTIDDLTRNTFEQQKLNKFFTHASGHGVGLDIHEGISFAENSKDTLQTNEVVTIEPGLYIPRQFGIRIEDMLIVKPAKSENITLFSKKIQNAILNLT